MPTDRNHILPLTPSPNQPSKTTTKFPSPPKFHRRHRRRILCCSAVVAVVAITLLVVSLTVYKVREPKMTLNSFTINQLNSTRPSTNLTVLADVSVKNPNAATFKFGTSTTSLFYRGRLMGTAYGPPGTARAHRTFRANLTVDVMADRLLNDVDLLGDLQAGSVELSTSTKVGGRVKILGLFKRHVDVMMNCTAAVSVSKQEILEQDCRQRVWV